MELASIALGANLGERLAALRASVQALGACPDVALVAASAVYEAEAHTLVPKEEQPPYLNAVLMVRTCLMPVRLLDLCRTLERQAGRRSVVRWAPRTLDVDLLTWGRAVIHTEKLALPHPRLGERRFVLQPWHDVAPHLYVPAPYEATVATLLRRCEDMRALVRTRLALV